MNYDVLWSTKWCAKVKNSMSKHIYFAPDRDSILLITILKSSSDAVLVPTSPGYQALVPQIVICVQLGSFFLVLLHRLMKCSISTSYGP